jgi:hypothetical protein
MDSRQLNGLQIAILGGIVEKNPFTWIVPSQTSKQKYTVKTTEKGPVCNCYDCVLRRTICKHIWAVTYVDVWANAEDFPNTDPWTLESTKSKSSSKMLIIKMGSIAGV